MSLCPNLSEKAGGLLHGTFVYDLFIHFLLLFLPMWLSRIFQNFPLVPFRFGNFFLWSSPQT
jgi:hypothetical protein